MSFNGGAISWRSKKQPIVALSSCEAEYIALADAGKEFQWLSKIHSIFADEKTVLIYEDNQSTTKCAQNSTISDRTKHIDVRYHHLRELVSNKNIKLEYLESTNMIADQLTKPLAKTLNSKHVSGMGLRV